MRVRGSFVLPPDKARRMRRAVVLEWLTLFFMGTVVVIMYLAMSGSQAMKTAWLEDLAGLIPAISFLIAHHFERRPPDSKFPYGFYKAVPIAYLISGTAILGVGGYVLIDGGLNLVKLEHPTIGAVSLFGHDVWAGWVMLAALAYSIVPPVILGHLKLPLGRDLCDRVLLADADMQKADWMTGGAAMVGIVGVGFGYWWADSVAAMAIALSVTYDGVYHVVHALRNLADATPAEMNDEGEEDGIAGKVRRAVERLPWVAYADVQLRDEGRPVTGIVFVRPKRRAADDLKRLQEARRVIEAVDWRLYQVVVTSFDGR